MILDLSRTTTFDQIVELVAEAAATAEPGAWILGRGWHQERWNPAPAVTYEGERWRPPGPQRREPRQPGSS